MDHRQRMEACISGQKVDRPPIALWRHFPVDDQSPQDLARSIVFFQETYDFDFVKITPASSYCLKGYGSLDEWRGSPEGTREYTNRPVKEPEDWLKLPDLSPHDGSLGATLEAIRLIRGQVDANTPVIQTIFDPLSQAKNLAGNDTLIAHMRLHPQAVIEGLKRITENTLAFVEECKKTQIDGIFFAIQHAQAHLLGLEEFRSFVLKFDRQILDSIKGLWLNLIHVHGKNIYFDEVSTLPAGILNWHDQETVPSLADGKKQFPGAVCGGLKQWNTLAYQTPAAVTAEANAAIESTNGERFILGTGCVLPIIAPHANILAVRNAVERYT